MTAVLDTIDNAIHKRIPVYIYCWGGVGRTGTVVGCFLIRSGMANSQDVIEKIARLRADDPKAYRRSPETSEQGNFVKNWHLHETGKAGRLA